MPSSDNTSIVLILGSILLLSLFYIFSGQPIHNEGALQTKRAVNGGRSSEQEQEYDSESEVSDNASDESSDVSEDSEESQRAEKPDVRPTVNRRQADADDSVDSSLEIIRERAMGLNGPYYRRKNGNKYKHNSYRALGAGTDLKQVDRQFRVADVTKNYTDRFVPVDESDGQQAPVNIKNNKGTGTNKHDVNAFLPQQKEKDWFETIETVDVKNSHLINIYRPIGANTIGSSHKGAIYDLRGLDKAVCPKFVVSPWMQSSWEPDRSSKSLCA
ncbi:hypothetical protein YASMINEVIRUS_804 [Yasminevirus sp. GU-2018]|uniref:Minor capsid protein P11 C-terminal conserved region domain-containing protein n=1 Tax=Yasminevirus sp. GU-2018 TaxID=2420051 RepID=A0A5K0U9S7_9VIRU|nr:hypothetical protein YASMINEVIRUS_804 [Yasminevirus sp. GU-2018]